MANTPATTTDPPASRLDQEIRDLETKVASVARMLQLRATALLLSPSTAAALSDPPLPLAQASPSPSPSSSSPSHSHSHPHSHSHSYSPSSFSAPLPASGLSFPALLTSPHGRLRSRLAQQTAHAQRHAYRVAAGGVTSFRVRDPDPRAVDHGRVLGLRFETMSKGRFLAPYCVFLNKPYADSDVGTRSDRGGHGQDSDGGDEHDVDGPVARKPTKPPSAFLRVHRHTVPSCIPLPGLAARYLPPPHARQERDRANDQHPHQRERTQTQPRPITQDLHGFVRALRREIISYHNRLGLVADAKRAIEASNLAAYDGSERHGHQLASETVVQDMTAADAEVGQLQIRWADGRTGRAVINQQGVVNTLIVFDHQGRRVWNVGPPQELESSEHSLDADMLVRRLCLFP